MNNKTQDLVGKRLSFHQLFYENKFIVEIPIIQRDYAQGRKNKREVRDLFLQALYDYLEQNDPDKDLDFVYGSTEVEKNLIKFIPLDGQQRLTTLFLLHWYLATISGNFKNYQTLMIQENKSRFTYLTRISSTDFVDALLLNEINLNNLLPSTGIEDDCLSRTIKDKGWYYLSWGYDPTIQSMLTMLDAIHKKFEGKGNYYERLISLNTPVITFQYLNLKEFSLTEDIYIKMNSRGKPLTSFENFKAKLEQHITSLFGEKDKPFFISTNKIKASYREYFSFQIDTTWAKLFWKYKHLVGKPFTFDEELMNFIRVIIANQYAIDHTQTQNDFKDLVKNESATSDLTENISFHKFHSLNVLTKNFIIYLMEACDALVNGDKKIKNYLPDRFYFNENEIFEKALKYTLSLPERALFHAYLRFLITHKSDTVNFLQWMRVIHNLVENTRIEEPEHLINAIKSIENLLPYSNDILNFLASKKCKIDFFASWQVEEEKLKAHLILKSGEWKEIIEDFEKKSFHSGQLGYLFEFSEILSYYMEHKNCNWSIAEDNSFYKSFVTYASKSIALFAINDTSQNDYILERALLTKGDYLIPSSNWRKNFCSSKRVANYQRDYSWKRLLRFTIEDIDQWKTRRSFVKNVLDDKTFNIDDVVNSLNKMCDDLPEDWRRYFIDNSDLIDYCSQGFIRKIDVLPNIEIELFSESQLNHYHIDMYVYNFYINYLNEKEELFAPFKDTNWSAVKNSDDPSFALLKDWSYKKKYYCIKIYRVNGAFVIEFEKEKGLKNKSEFSNEIAEILMYNKFKWDEEDKAYYIQKGSEKSTVEVLKKLCTNLNLLQNE